MKVRLVITSGENVFFVLYLKSINFLQHIFCPCNKKTTVYFRATKYPSNKYQKFTVSQKMFENLFCCNIDFLCSFIKHVFLGLTSGIIVLKENFVYFVIRFITLKKDILFLEIFFRYGILLDRFSCFRFI